MQSQSLSEALGDVKFQLPRPALLNRRCIYPSDPRISAGNSPREQSESVALPVCRWVRAAGRGFRGTRGWVWNQGSAGDVLGRRSCRFHTRQMCRDLHSIKKILVFVAPLLPSHVVFRENTDKNSEFSPPNISEGSAPVSREDWVELQRLREWFLIYNNSATEKEFGNQPFWQNWIELVSNVGFFKNEGCFQIGNISERHFI